MGTQVEQRFSNFYDNWMSKLEHLLQLLLLVSRQPPSFPGISYEAMVDKLTGHHKEYYTFKWAAANEDVLAFFGPLWLTPLENAYLWFTGWKPSTAFRLLDSLRAKTRSPPPASGSVAGMTEEQVGRIEALRARIKVEEERVEREMEQQQVAIADRRMLELARLEEGEETNGILEAALKGLLAGLERVMKMADCVRLKTLKGVLEVLTPMQSVDFLAATSMLLIHLRKWGKKRSSAASAVSTI